MACRVATASRALDDAEHCGDQVFATTIDQRALLCLADGLGHGVEAERAARAAVDYVAAHKQADLDTLFRGCNEALLDTRGVALAVAVVAPAEGTLTYAAVGNVRGRIVGAERRYLPSAPGIVGAGYDPLNPLTVHTTPGSLLVLFSDGLDEHLELPAVPPPASELQRLADELLVRWSKGTDDAAIMLCTTYTAGGPR